MTASRERISWTFDNFDKICISFSGGKDSTVLLDLVRRIYLDVKGAYSDTGLEYPEIREFVKSFDNIDWLKPKKNFVQIITEYGYPIVSKEVSENISLISSIKLK